MIDRRTVLAMLAAIPVAACSTAPPKGVLIVYKSPHCECCGAWIEHVKASGIPVQVFETELVSDQADKLKVPQNMRACHTSEFDGYFIEGHVPAADIRRLIRERPKARGLAVPGMPIGSPGMEQGDRRDRYGTLLIDNRGRATVFALHNQPSAAA